jgi:hypothetical protein
MNNLNLLIETSWSVCSLNTFIRIYTICLIFFSSLLINAYLTYFTENVVNTPLCTRSMQRSRRFRFLSLISSITVRTARLYLSPLAAHVLVRAFTSARLVLIGNDTHRKRYDR